MSPPAARRSLIALMRLLRPSRPVDTDHSKDAPCSRPCGCPRVVQATAARFLSSLVTLSALFAIGTASATAGSVSAPPAPISASEEAAHLDSEAGGAVAPGANAQAPLPIAALDPRAPHYSVERWGTDQGLPSDAVNSVAQTLDGYIWVATNAGLARFDGVRFTHFDHANTPELQSDGCHRLLRDREGGLWIATLGGGVTHLLKGEFTAYGAAEGVRFEYAMTAFEGKNRNVCVLR